jgi:hypothetical protein
VSTSQSSEPAPATTSRQVRARHAATLRRLERARGMLASAAIARMDATLPWYRAMPAEQRSWVGLVAQAGIAAFTEWFRQPDAHHAVSADVFGTAPRDLVRTIRLQQTVELIRVSIEVVEERIEELAAPGDEALLREAVLRYSRELAFATARVYARAAEARGAWDARLEALVVDALMRGETGEGISSRAAALGWGSPSPVFVILGAAPDVDAEAAVDGIHRASRRARLTVLCGVQGDRLVTIVGGAPDPEPAGRALAGQFGPGPIVLGPLAADLPRAAASAREALAGLRAAPAWPQAPRPVAAAELLPERALAGDPDARRALLREVYQPLREADAVLMDTLTAFLEQTTSLEAAARLLFVHPNTVRYRLRRVMEITGYTPADPRSAFALRTALVLGRLDEAGVV